MKNLCFILLILCFCAGCHIIKKEPQTVIVEGSVVKTPELNYAECDKNDPTCHCIDDGIWCWKESIVTVDITDDDLVFVDKPWLEVVGPTAGSAEWNKLHLKENIPSDRFEIIEDLPNRKKARVLSSSNSIEIKLVCRAAKK
jgi:hypothetical protein